MTTSTLAAWSLSALLLVPADETARGAVFHDADRDGVRDADEPGVPGVAVSNGRDVVETDADGRYTLTVREHDVVFVTKPAGWAVPRDARGLPSFFHVHAPDGTPPELGLRYPGVDPTGPLPDALDFPLHRDPTESERFDAIWIADPQPTDDAELGHVRDAFVSSIVGVDAEFGITVGDIMFDDLSLLPRSAALFGRIGIPWYHVPGNHELNFLSPDDRWSTETFRRHFGPTDYSFDVGRAHFVVLDDVWYRGVDDDGSSGGYDARLTDAQLDWLAADLARVPTDGLVVVAMHIPLGGPAADGSTHVRVDGAQGLFDVLAPYENLLLIAGHTHTSEHHRFDAAHGFDGDEPLHLHVLSTVSGSWWSGPVDEHGIPTSWCRDGTPKGYYVMEVDGAAVSLRFVGLGRRDDDQIHLSFATSLHRDAAASGDVRVGELVAGRIARSRLATTELVANVFNGGPRSRATVRIDGGEPVVMTRRYATDPFFDALYDRHADEMKSWVEPVPSTHLWVAPLPRDLAGGPHTLLVEAVDEYGATHTARAVLEVTDG